MERAELYDAALLASFERFMLGDGARPVFANLVPDPDERPHSSLGYMMQRVAERFGSGRSGFYLRDQGVDVTRFATACGARLLRASRCASRPPHSHSSPCSTPCGHAARRSRYRRAHASWRREASRAAREPSSATNLRARERCLRNSVGVDRRRVRHDRTDEPVLDSPASRAGTTRVKTGPPWLRSLVVDEAGREMPAGVTGFVQHVDLANRSSVLAIRTEDRAYTVAGGFVLVGRAQDAPLRGCSLDAEDLRARGAALR